MVVTHLSYPRLSVLAPPPPSFHRQGRARGSRTLLPTESKSRKGSAGSRFPGKGSGCLSSFKSVKVTEAASQLTAENEKAAAPTAAEVFVYICPGVFSRSLRHECSRKSLAEHEQLAPKREQPRKIANRAPCV